MNMKWTPVKGWESEAEQGLLVTLLRTMPTQGVYVEIGSEFGMSASLALLYAVTASVYAIEINPDAPFVQNIKDAGIDTEWLIPVIGDSKTVAIPDEVIEDGIDLLFVDGDHSFDGALADLERWSQHLNTGGVIVVHDCACNTNKAPHPDHYAVYSAVQHFLASHAGRLIRYAFSVDSTMVLIDER